MATGRDIGVIGGGEHLAKAAERVFLEVDKYVAPVPVINVEWSKVLNIGLGVALPALAVWRRVRDPWGTVMVASGMHMTTKIWDYLEEALPAAPAARAVTVTRPQGATPVVSRGGRY
mgnify:CR=1 FL=1